MPKRIARTITMLCVVGYCLACCVASPAVHAQERQCAVPLSAPEDARLQQWDVSESFLPAHKFATGKGVRVAVIDTGVARHPLLGDVTYGKDFVQAHSTGSDNDCDAHGTIVASVIAARGTGPHGPTGVAPDATIISIKQSTALGNKDASQGTVGTLAEAIHEALAQDAQVINISVVSCFPPDRDLDVSMLEDALRAAEAQGVVVVAAAGNQHQHCEPGFKVLPAHIPTVIAVRSLADPYTITDYSIPAPKATLAAHGTVFAALSTQGDGISHALQTTQSPQGSPYIGTSFAAPMVAGAVALLKERHPDWAPEKIRSHLFASSDPATGAIDIPRLIQTDAQPAPKLPPQRITVAELPGAQPKYIWWVLFGAVIVFALITSTRSNRR